MRSFAPIAGRRIRFGLVGCGRISKNHIEALKKHDKHAEQDCESNRALAACALLFGGEDNALLIALIVHGSHHTNCPNDQPTLFSARSTANSRKR